MNDSKTAQIKTPEAPWTRSEVDFLAENRFNMSLSDIGRHLGRSRNAVAGKAARLGIKTTALHHSRMITQALVKAHATGKYANRQFKHIKTTFVKGGRAESQHMKEPDVGILNGIGVKMGEIENHHCKWVVGDPSEFTCCGNRRLEGSPYCESHHKIAYKPRKASNG